MFTWITLSAITIIFHKHACWNENTYTSIIGPRTPRARLLLSTFFFVESFFKIEKLLLPKAIAGIYGEEPLSRREWWQKRGFVVLAMIGVLPYAVSMPLAVTWIPQLLCQKVVWMHLPHFVTEGWWAVSQRPAMQEGYDRLVTPILHSYIYSIQPRPLDHRLYDTWCDHGSGGATRFLACLWASQHVSPNPIPIYLTNMF